MANSNDQKKTIKITLVKSLIGYPKRQKDTAHALGLRKIHQTVEHIDSPALRGMVAKIVHLVTVEE